jgi:hypothetical protein
MMLKYKQHLDKEKLQYQIYTGLSLIVFLLAGLLYFFDRHIFTRLIGSINPLIAVAAIIISGFILLSFLLYKGWFTIYKKENLKGLLLRSCLALLFVPISVFIDIKVGFWKELNVLFPQSLLFYPAIGFTVEILFHAMPLTILLVLLTSICKNVNRQKIIWVCLSIVMLLEPVYQTEDMFSSEHFPLWSSLLIFLNLFLFNFTQLFLFKKYDFITMYSFRLVYYFVWHIVWGHFRLEWLF